MIQRFFWPIAFAPALCLLPTLVSAGTSLDAEYRVRLRGIPIATAHLAITADGERYSVDASARTDGVFRIISDGEASGKAEGAIAGETLVPAQYDQHWLDDEEEERLALRFKRGKVADVAITPAPKKKRKVVPVKAEHKSGVLDPLSALVFPAPSSDARSVCERTIPIFDGRQRFDLELAFSRIEPAPAGSQGFGQAAVCSIRYRAVAGHRPGRSSVRFMEENEDMEVWMAAVGDSNLMAPVRLHVRTRAGMLDLEARHFAAAETPKRDASVKN